MTDCSSTNDFAMSERLSSPQIGSLSFLPSRTVLPLLLTEANAALALPLSLPSPQPLMPPHPTAFSRPRGRNQVHCFCAFWAWVKNARIPESLILLPPLILAPQSTAMFCFKFFCCSSFADVLCAATRRVCKSVLFFFCCKEMPTTCPPRVVATRNFRFHYYATSTTTALRMIIPRLVPSCEALSFPAARPQLFARPYHAWFHRAKRNE